MCLDPLTAAALGATVLGGALQMKGNRQAEKARSGAYNAEMARQEGLRGQQYALFGDTLAGFDRGAQEAKRTDLTGKRGDVIDQSVIDTGPVDPSAGLEGSAPKVVKDTAAKTIVNALASARKEGKSLAALNGFGDLFFDNQIGLNRSGIDQARLADYSAGSSGVLPLELEAANAKGSGMRGFGQLLQGAGQIAGLAGGYGVGQAPSPALYSKPIQFPWSV